MLAAQAPALCSSASQHTPATAQYTRSRCWNRVQASRGSLPPRRRRPVAAAAAAAASSGAAAPQAASSSRPGDEYFAGGDVRVSIQACFGE